MPINTSVPSTAARVVALRMLCLVLAALALLASGTSTAQAAATPAAPPVEVQPDDVLARLGDETITRAAFDEEFEIAARSTALQQGLEPTPEVMAQFEAFRHTFLEQLATQLVLVHYARDNALAAEEAEVDEVVDEVRLAQGDEEGFARYLETAGFGDELALRALVERSMTVQNVVDALAADIEVSDADIEAWYEANPEQVQTAEGLIPLEAVRDEIAAILTRERIDELVQELVAAAPLEVYAERL